LVAVVADIGRGEISSKKIAVRGGICKDNDQAGEVSRDSGGRFSLSRERNDGTGCLDCTHSKEKHLLTGFESDVDSSKSCSREPEIRVEIHLHSRSRSDRFEAISNGMFFKVNRSSVESCLLCAHCHITSHIHNPASYHMFEDGLTMESPQTHSLLYVYSNSWVSPHGLIPRNFRLSTTVLPRP
jgi:hypothetical protein